ncbi:MAG: aminopeptidase [Pseudomonadota bacterium]
MSPESGATPRRWRRWVALAAVALVLSATVSLNGCYYLRAASGQWSVLNKREDIDQLLEAGTLEPAVAEQLELVRDARAFAVGELALPDNGSYLTYADIGRPYVVWNVFAAPELALEPYRWCFPIVGCVAYRGHFAEERAHRDAARLEKKGYDTYVGGVPAYSTLGRFRDPVLSTMLGADSVGLVATLFHELAHQQFYVKGDAEFNESYATAVADIGLARWADARVPAEAVAAYRRRRALRDDFNALALATRERLATVYQSEQPEAEKRALKAQVFAELSDAYATLATERNLTGTPRSPANNAMLVPIATYYALVPAFMRLYEDCGRDLTCFYERSAAIAALPDRESRRAALADVAVPAP